MMKTQQKRKLSKLGVIHWPMYLYIILLFYIYVGPTRAYVPHCNPHQHPIFHFLLLEETYKNKQQNNSSGTIVAQ